MTFVNLKDPSGNPIFAMICPSHQLKNTIAALYSSRPTGSKKLTLEVKPFGWETIEKIYDQEIERAETGRSRKVPGLKYAFVYRDNWT
ncbi:uncharacterized protein LOC122949620 [Acropora millepora]|uniref:uncharacterized protein LOC122949620 n=1 Tax=Acropora millepora TaxID=45264 RepID=UPI001CF3209B|nr:uncharacterized protein LOC122949620 [Acropora millepora]